MNAQFNEQQFLVNSHSKGIESIQSTDENGLLDKGLIDLRALTLEDLYDLFNQLGHPRFRANQLFRWLWKKEFRDFSEISDFPITLREQLTKIASITHLTPVEILTSKDKTQKIVFELPQKNFIETVLIPEDKRQTICVSTQVGCQMGCAFCMTGKMGFKRNLLASEIALQVLETMNALNLPDKPRNIVFMGMGEPLMNLHNLIKAIKILTCQYGLNYSLRHITVSTCGLVPEMLELGENLDVGLAISLHATDNKTRDMLMPINRKYPLEVLLEACRNYRLSPRRRITFEYILIKDVNDSPDDAKRLARLLSNIKAKINLIPFNEVESLPFRRPSDERISKFQEILLMKNFTTVVRKSRGGDIMAACGQLYRKFVGCD